jgi:hypothetical protein
MAKPILTAARLRELLHYDPETGVFTCLIKRGNWKLGQIVGCQSTADGYPRIRIEYKLHLSHRLAWLYVYGEWPGQLDHIDNDRANCRIANLRDVSQFWNMQNLKKARSDSSTGVLGVTYCKATGKYRAKIKANGKFIEVGRFVSVDEAGSAYIEAKRRLHQGCTI